jgi:hypothetical protein
MLVMVFPGAAFLTSFEFTFMTSILLTNTVTATTVSSFIDNRLREFGIEDAAVTLNLHAAASTIHEIIKAHFAYSFHLPIEEDLYFDEVVFAYDGLINEVKAYNLQDECFKSFIFVLIKVLDQIIIEAKEQGLHALVDATQKTEVRLMQFL